MEDLILKKYFEDNMKQIEIVRELKIPKYKVSRILTKDARYQEEKEKRRKEAQKHHIEKTKLYIANSRKNKELEYARLKQAHIQATMELSGGNKPINNRAFRNWNSSVYKYDEKRKSYILKRGIIVGADVPKQIKW